MTKLLWWRATSSRILRIWSDSAQEYSCHISHVAHDIIQPRRICGGEPFIQGRHDRRLMGEVRDLRPLQTDKARSWNCAIDLPADGPMLELMPGVVMDIKSPQRYRKPSISVASHSAGSKGAACKANNLPAHPQAPCARASPRSHSGCCISAWRPPC